jgi:hypothetical protein
VNPRIEVSVYRDAKAGTWRYVYRVSNRRPATQALTKLGLVLRGTVESATAPEGWLAVIYNPPAIVPGVTFAADRRPDGSRNRGAPPGGAPVVFEILSKDPPGPVEFYARGSAPVIAMEGLSPVMRARMPAEQEDAQRGETTGPTTTWDVPSPSP